MFNFNEYSAPLLPGFIQGVVFAVILLLRARREERISDVFAALLLLAGSLFVAQWMLGFAGWYDERDWRTTIMNYMEWKHVLAFGPLIWLYFRSLTNTNFRWEKKYGRHFLPLVVLWLWPFGIFLYDFVFVWLLKGETFTYFGGSHGPAANWDDNLQLPIFEIIYGLSVIHLLVYLRWTLEDYKKYLVYLGDEFSNTEQLTFSNLRLTLYLLLAGVLLTIGLDLVNIFLNENYIDSWDSYFMMSVFTFFAAIQFFAINPRETRALRFQPDREPVTTSATIPSKINTPATVAPDPDLQRWAERVDERLKEHKDYLNPDLKLGDLAEAIGTNGSILSKVINSRYGMNFNDFINARRCHAFLTRIKAGDHHQHTLLSIALDSGFNSKSTFNRAFRKAKGMSPREAVNLAET